MTNEQLKAFLAVVEQGSFRKAAKTIFKTQAAVSASIKTLEEQYDVLLFNRQEYRPTLTEAGQTFYHNAKLTMDHFDRLDKIGRQLSEGIEPKFRIVVSIAYPLPTLLKQIKTIVDQFPDTQFMVHTEALNGVVERIDDEKADLAFGPEIGLNATHERIPIAKVNVVNVAAPGYFKKNTQDEISLEEIAEYAQIVIRDSAKHSDPASYHLAPNRESWSVNDFNTKKELILAGLGWGGLPEHLIEKELTAGTLIPIKVEGIPLISCGDLYMFRSRNHKKGPVATQFWNELIAIYTAP